jgi:hypothetical protein
MTAVHGMAAAALAAAAVVAGCGLGPGSASEGTATLTVTRDYGAREVDNATESDPSESETVLRFLDRNAEITTRYGGGFVQSIDGLAGATSGTRRSDWFFYLNGIESPVGATGVRVHGGDRIWWDYRDWTDAMRVPAVVGSYPQPFEAASGTVDVDCAGARAPCDTVAGALRDDGVHADVERGLGRSGDLPRVLVGPWTEVRRDAAARQIQEGQAVSGVFARFDGSKRLVTLDVGADESFRLGAGAGLVAAVRLGDDAPTWLVTGTDPKGVAAAASRLDADDLADRYALAIADGETLPLPIQGPEGPG